MRFFRPGKEEPMKGWPLLGCLVIALGPSTFAAGEAAVEADVVHSRRRPDDGTGRRGQVGDLAIKGERIVAVGTFKRGQAAAHRCDRAGRRAGLHRPAHAQRLAADAARPPAPTSVISARA